MDYEHRLKLSEIRWDKGVFAVVLALVGATGIYCGNRSLDDRRTEAMQKMEAERREAEQKLEKEKAANAKGMEKFKQDEARKIEEFRTRETRERVLTEKRLEALTAISAAHSRMTRAFFRYSNEEPDAPAEKATQDYKAAIDDFMHETNKHLPLLGQEFDKDVSWYTMCHRKFREIGVTKCDKYGTLASNLDNEFNALCEGYLNKGAFPTENRMVLKPIYREERITIKKPEDYIVAQVAYRKQHGKDDKLP